MDTDEIAIRIKTLEASISTTLNIARLSFAVLGILVAIGVSTNFFQASSLQSRLSQIEDRVALLPGQFNESSRTLTQSVEQLRAVEIRLTTVANQLGPLQKTVETINNNIGTLDRTFGTVEPRLQRIDQRIDQIYGVLVERREKR